MSEEKKIGAELSYRTSMALKKFLSLDVGEGVNREQMSEEMNAICEPGSVGYGNVNSARRIALNRHGVNIQWCKSLKAWVRRSSAESVADCSSGTQKARRVANRAIKIGATVNTKELSESEQSEHSAAMQIAGMQANLGKPGLLKRLKETGIQPSNHSLENITAFLSGKS